MLRALRVLLVLDAVLLFVVGAALVFVPRQLAVVFQFRDLPHGVYYLVAMWGCVMATMGIGYAVAAQDPVRHVAWVQVGIARGALECLVGLAYVALGILTFRQAVFGILLGGLIAVLYGFLYPRE